MDEILTGIIDVYQLTAANADFREEDGYLSLRITDGETREYDRVLLNRCFPFDEPESHLSVSDPDGTEIGMISDVNDLKEADREACRRELARRYFTRKILAIRKIRERYGFTRWDVVAETGPLNFSLQDTYRSITKVTPDHLLITDVDGNIYEIESLEKLSYKSYRQIELYL